MKKGDFLFKLMFLKDAIRIKYIRNQYIAYPRIFYIPHYIGETGVSWLTFYRSNPALRNFYQNGKNGKYFKM